MKKPSASQLIPEEIQHQLMEAADLADQACWRIGDIADMMAVELPTVPHHELFAAIGTFCQRSGDTVRDYRELAVFWDQKSRNQYPQFGRHHIRAVKAHSEGNGVKEKRANAKELLNQALEASDSFGGVPSVASLRAWLYKRNGPPLAWPGRLLRLVRCITLIEHDEQAPSSLREFLHHLAEKVSKWVE